MYNSLINKVLIVSMAIAAAAVSAFSAPDSLHVSGKQPDTAAANTGTVVVSSTEKKAAFPGDFAVVDDIAISSAAKVFHNDLGLVIRNANGGVVTVAIHDAKGRVVVKRNLGAAKGVVSFSTDEFPTGVYIYTVRIADSVYTKPFMVTR